MGFMKMGVSLMGLFFLTIAIAGTMDLEVVILLSVVIWFYAFFHVHNLAGMEEDHFREVKDDYLFHISSLEKGKEWISFYRKAVAGVLIFLGAVMLWDVICRFLLDYLHFSDRINDMVYGINDVLPRIVISIAIIILGVHMIKGKKKEVDLMPEEGQAVFSIEGRAADSCQTEEKQVQQADRAETDRVETDTAETGTAETGTAETDTAETDTAVN